MLYFKTYLFNNRQYISLIMWFIWIRSYFQLIKCEYIDISDLPQNMMESIHSFSVYILKLKLFTLYFCSPSFYQSGEWGFRIIFKKKPDQSFYSICFWNWPCFYIKSMSHLVNPFPLFLWANFYNIFIPSSESTAKGQSQVKGVVKWVQKQKILIKYQSEISELTEI